MKIIRSAIGLVAFFLFAAYAALAQTIRCTSNTPIPASTTTVTASLCSGAAVGDFALIQAAQGGTFGSAFSGPGFINTWNILYQDSGTPFTAGAAYTHTLLLNDVTTGTVSVNSTSGGPGGFTLTVFVGSGVTVQNTYHAQGGSGISSPITGPTITGVSPFIALYFFGTSQTGSGTLAVSRGTQQGSGTFNTSFNTVSYQEVFGSNLTYAPTYTWSGTSGLGYVINEITVNPPTGPPPLTLLPGTCTGSGAQGTQYVGFGGCSLQTTGGAGGNTFTYSTARFSYALPEGLSLNASTGAITGTPFGAGNYPVTFTVTDSSSNTSTLTVTFPIAGNYVHAGGWTFFPLDAVTHLRVDSLPVDTSIAAPLLSAYLGTGIQFETDVNNGGIPWAAWPADESAGTVTTLWPGYNVGANLNPFSLSSPDFTSSIHDSTQVDQIARFNPIEATQNNSCALTAYCGDGHSSAIILPGTGPTTPPRLLEQYNSQYNGGQWYNHADANFDMSGYQMPLQDVGEGVDAAGLCLACFLVTYDEAAAGTIDHAARFTLNGTLNYHVWPATAQAGGGACIGGYQDSNHLILQPGSPGGAPPVSNCSGGPMGEIYRLPASFDSSAVCVGNSVARNVLAAWYTYGIILADNGRTGSITAAADSRWPDMSCLTGITLGDFEPVNVQSVIKTLDGSNLPTVSYQTTTSTPTVATPTFSPVAGSYGPAQTVTISTSTGGASLVYTTDGTTPTVTALTCTITHGTLYSGSLTVSTSQTLNAIGCLSGDNASSVGSAAYVINGAASAPTFSPPAGTFTGTQVVSLSTSSGGCSGSIVWNTTGAASGGNLTGVTTGTSVTVPSSETVYSQVQSCSAFTNSSIASAAYVINPPPPPSGGIGLTGIISGSGKVCFGSTCP